jgi:hypothetical protein
MLPEWLKSIFRGTRKEAKETVVENVEAVANVVSNTSKAVIASEIKVINSAFGNNALVGEATKAAEKALDDAVDTVVAKAAKNVKKAATKKAVN